jgi:uncharacterized protein (DUF885 family)
MSTPDFVPLAERIIDELFAAEPDLAGDTGDHRFDDRLPDLSPGAVAERVTMLRDASGALSGVDTDDLDLAERVDHEQLLSLVERRLFSLTEIREHEWNPLAHNPGGLLYDLMARPFAPLPQRLESLALRLGAVPDAMATARTVLQDCSRIHLETAVGQFRGAAGMLRSQVPPLLEQAPELAGTVGPAAQVASEALESFADWAAASASALASAAAGDAAGRDPRLGRRLWEAKLWHTLDTELTAADVLRQARAALDEVSELIRAAAVELVGGRADDDTVRRALNRLADEHPTNESIVELARVTLDETTSFVRSHQLVSLVDDPCIIQEMPEYMRGVAVANCESAAPFDPPDTPTFFNIAPAPAGWEPSKVESFYREYNNHLVRNLTVHEAMPGHYVQCAHARRYRGSTRTRAVTRSGTFVEGWAVYAEEMMIASGFGGLPIRLQQLKMRLRSIINAILDQLVHCEDLTEGEAMALMIQRGFQEEGEAAGKWRRALLTSTQLSTYFVGHTEVAAIAAARPSSVPLGEWHDRMLAHGTPSPRHLRTLLRLA